jgi:hypothetical protein
VFGILTLLSLGPLIYYLASFTPAYRGFSAIILSEKAISSNTMSIVK